MSIALLEHTKYKILSHEPDACASHTCSLHNRSSHSMRSFPQHWRSDRGIMERICPHGVGHPDPDCIYAMADLTHGCDGCCTGAYSS